MDDAEIRAHLRQIFYEEPSFLSLGIREARNNKFEVIREPAKSDMGSIDIEVADGVITLNGTVPGLVSKRLAGAIAWWMPGRRDVINGIAVEHREEDAPIRIQEAVKVILGKNPFVDASQIRVHVGNWDLCSV